MQNNYDGRASNADRSRADFYVRIPRDQVPAYKVETLFIESSNHIDAWFTLQVPASGNRDVYVVPNGIDLRDVKDVKIGQRAGKRQWFVFIANTCYLVCICFFLLLLFVLQFNLAQYSDRKISALH